jgi:hypothetical protein
LTDAATEATESVDAWTPAAAARLPSDAARPAASCVDEQASRASRAAAREDITPAAVPAGGATVTTHVPLAPCSCRRCRAPAAAAAAAAR